MAARRALLDRAGPEHDRVGSSAFRADETPRPAPREQGCPTLFLGAILQPKGRFAYTLLELHNVLGHPNLPQSLSSSSLYHSPRKLKFVGNQEKLLGRPATPATPGLPRSTAEPAGHTRRHRRRPAPGRSLQERRSQESRPP